MSDVKKRRFTCCFPLSSFSIHRSSHIRTYVFHYSPFDVVKHELHSLIINSHVWHPVCVFTFSQYFFFFWLLFVHIFPFSFLCSWQFEHKLLLNSKRIQDTSIHTLNTLVTVFRSWMKSNRKKIRRLKVNPLANCFQQLASWWFFCSHFSLRTANSIPFFCALSGFFLFKKKILFFSDSLFSISL